MLVKRANSNRELRNGITNTIKELEKLKDFIIYLFIFNSWRSKVRYNKVETSHISKFPELGKFSSCNITYITNVIPQIKLNINTNKTKLCFPMKNKTNWKIFNYSRNEYTCSKWNQFPTPKHLLPHPHKNTLKLRMKDA